uniref:Transposase (Putative), gypsy type n=1 Tax=Tanacetum cinerariifolium TaxID=118510 RepID=A0A6L2LIB2_TANCI|nr:hypothetical protein [Tanacetum cinerariifolium]
MSKNDMKNHVSTLSKSDLEDFDSSFTMDRLPSDAIGVYFEFLWFSGVRVSFLTFLLSVLKYFKDDAKIVEEPHHLFEPLLERVSSHTTTPAVEGALIPLPTLNELKDSMERDEGTSIRAASVPTPRLGKRLGPPLLVTVTSISGPLHVGTSAYASTSGRSLALGGSVAGGFVRKSGAKDTWHQMDPLDALAYSTLSRDAEYDEVPEDDFYTATRGEEIKLTLFPLAPGPITCLIHTKVSLLLYILKRNGTGLMHQKVISYNSLYTDLVASRVRLQEKLDRKKGDVKLLRSEVTSLENKLEKLQRDYDTLGQENRDLHSQRDVASFEVKKLQSQLADARGVSVGLTDELAHTDAKLSEQALNVRDLQNELASKRSRSQGYMDAADELRVEITQFIGSSVEGLVQRLLLSDEFHAALTHVASLAAQKVSNFHIGAKADFNKALVAFPTTMFPFLGNVAMAARGALSKVTQILPDKLARLATSAYIAPFVVNEGSDQVPLNHAFEDLASSM